MTDETRGKAKHVAGEVKEKAADVLGDTEMEKKARLQKAEGRAEQDEARAREKAREASERRSAAKTARELED